MNEDTCVGMNTQFWMSIAVDSIYGYKNTYDSPRMSDFVDKTRAVVCIFYTIKKAAWLTKDSSL